ncbi:MAG: spermidine/putrescine ABC transporter substrate-binding protein [Micrococcales bacterium]|nr:spermidine/putrescine ABC transporter substrate-binding protein [Micrococcales bacterium]MCL2666379.1 spermidine/putrescine ABC transporter substrate-binding protein [Micrococcales bacterium]
MSRRAFLGLVGAAICAGALSACDTYFGGAKAGQLRWGNWPLYLDTDDAGTTHPTLERFTAESGIPVRYLEDIEDNDQFNGKVRARLDAGQDIGYDLVTLSDWMAQPWVRQGFAQRLDRSAMPNTSNLMPNLAKADYDPGRTLTMPWQAGLSGIAWRWDKVPGGLQELDDLWKPQYKGRVEVLTEFTSTLALALWATGVDPSTAWGDDEFETALEVIVTQRHCGQISMVRGNSIVEDLVNGDAWAIVSYSGDIYQKNQEAKDHPDDPDLFGFAVPGSGGVIWADHFIVPTSSTEVENAQKLIDFYYDPQVAAEVAASVNYITPVVGAREEMEQFAPHLVDHPLIFPDAETLDKCPLVRGFSAEEYTRYTKRFLQEMSGT